MVNNASKFAEAQGEIGKSFLLLSKAENLHIRGAGGRKGLTFCKTIYFIVSAYITQIKFFVSQLLYISLLGAELNY